jgi:hypothetical protein
MISKRTEPSGASVPTTDALEKDDFFKEERPSTEHLDIYQPSFTPQEQKKILRKVDWRLVPLLSFLYLVSFIDRGNCKSAAILLHLPLNQYLLTRRSGQCESRWVRERSQSLRNTV